MANTLHINQGQSELMGQDTDSHKEKIPLVLDRKVFEILVALDMLWTQHEQRELNGLKS